MARVLQSLDLFAPGPVEAPRSDSRPAPSKPQLWIAVCLPSLAFECLSAADSALPAVVVEAERGQLHVVAASRAAAEAGIASGTKLHTAMALAASLQVFERSPPLERQSLESLAEWAQMLTSMVSVEAPESLLLEVAGSLKLFGSLDAIKATLRGELARRYRHFRFCAAPTATAALWLARAASADVLQWRQLGRQLGGATARGDALAARGAGATTGPRAAHRRRLCAITEGRFRAPSRAFLFARARSSIRPLRRFACRVQSPAGLELDGRARRGKRRQRNLHRGGRAAPLRALRRASEATSARSRGFELAFEHLHRPPTVESFDLREPTFDRDRLLHLVEDRLERSALPVPAVALRMTSGVFRPLERKAADLFEAKPHDERAQALLERLQGRFGSSAVYGLRAVPEHRPEKAWAKWLETRAWMPAVEQRRDAGRMPAVEQRRAASCRAGSAAVMVAAEARGHRSPQRLAEARLGARANRERLVGRAGRRSRLLHGQERQRPKAVGVPRSPNSFLVLARAIRLTAGSHATPKRRHLRRASLPQQLFVPARGFAS